MKPVARALAAASCGMFTLIAGGAQAAVFSDDFNAGASALWGNEVGAWSASAGSYGAGLPGNFPNATSTLPWTLDAFSVEFDVTGLVDGGIWLRSSAQPGAIGRVGVLMVMAHGDLYWHVVTDANNYGASLATAPGLFSNGQSAHFRVDVSGSSYAAYIDGALAAASTLTDASFASGQVGLYSNSAQRFDNVRLSGDGVPAVPEPASAALLLLGLGLGGLMARRARPPIA